MAKKQAKNRPQYPFLQLPYLPNGTSVRAETFRLFSTQMYVSPVGKSAKSVRSLEQCFAVAGRGLGAIPPRGEGRSKNKSRFSDELYAAFYSGGKTNSLWIESFDK